MDEDEIIKIEKILGDLREPWDAISRETIESLGTDAALHILEYHGENWTEIVNEWMPNEYGQENRNDLTLMQFYRLFKEIFWLQFLFQTGNYTLMNRNLRYILEMFAQAYYADWNFQGLTLDGKANRIEEIEAQIYGWLLIEKVLCRVFACEKKNLDGEYNLMWKYLNKYVHPSAIQMNLDSQEDPASLYTDSFNENLARDALEITDKIFDIIYILIFNKYPKIKGRVLKSKFISKWEEYSPDAIKYFRE